MRTTSYSAFRRNLAATLDSVTDDGRGNPPSAAKPRNAARLPQAAAALDEGGGAERGLTQ
jgi:hypothetical protein